MKNIKRKSLLIVLFISASLYAFTNIFAEPVPAPGRNVPVEVRAFGYAAHDELTSQTNLITSMLLSTGTVLRNSIVSANFPNLDIMDTVEKYTSNSYLTGNDISAAGLAVKSFSNFVSANLARYYLAGSYIRSRDMLGGLANAFGENNEFIPAFWESTQFKTVLPSQITSQNAEVDVSDMLASIALNPDSFLNPDGYTSDQVNANKMLLNFVENVTEPPSVIRFYNSFDKMTQHYQKVQGKDEREPDQTKAPLIDKVSLTVPYSSDFTKKTSDVALSENQYNSVLCKLGINKLTKCSADDLLMYQEYKNAYRAQIVARMIYLSTLLDSYAKRVPINNKGGKSLAKLENEEANYRLQPTYLNAIKQAPIATLNLENLKLLAEIHNDLYMMRLQNEKTNILLSMVGMQALSLSASQPGSPISAMGKFLYCESKTVAGSTPPAECAAQSTTMPGVLK